VNDTAGWTHVIATLAGRIDRSFQHIFDALALPSRSLQFRPSPGAWTILEIAEHVTLTNHFLLLLVEKIAQRARRRSGAGELDPPPPSRFDALERLALPDFRWESPEHMRPSGSLDANSVCERLASQRDRVLTLLREFPCGEGALHRIRMSVVGPDERLDLYQFVGVIALHAERHAEQARRNAIAAASSEAQT
jgi:hypothetical protein